MDIYLVFEKWNNCEGMTDDELQFLYMKLKDCQKTLLAMDAGNMVEVYMHMQLYPIEQVLNRRNESGYRDSKSTN